jgi:hypothetical protein
MHSLGPLIACLQLLHAYAAAPNMNMPELLAAKQSFAQVAQPLPSPQYLHSMLLSFQR